MNNISIWRNDGVIEMIMSPRALVCLTTAFIGSHSSWNCTFIGEGIDAIRKQDIEEYSENIDRVVKTIEYMFDKIKTTHKVEGTNRIHLSDTFDGMFESTMHPVELSALAQDAEELLDRYGSLLHTDAKDASILHETWTTLIKANKELIRPAERLAALGNIEEAKA